MRPEDIRESAVLGTIAILAVLLTMAAIFYSGSIYFGR